jgi:hypothetical protein
VLVEGGEHVDVAAVCTPVRLELTQEAWLTVFVIQLGEVISLMPLLPIRRRDKFVIKIGPINIKPLYRKLINAHVASLAYLVQLNVVVVTGVLV